MTPRTPWSPGPASWQDDLSPLPPSEWNYDRAAHLLAHAGFGGAPEEIEKLADAGLDRTGQYRVGPDPGRPIKEGNMSDEPDHAML